MSARNLGRGLNALLGDADEPVQQPQGIKTVLLSDLEPSQFQPRRVFDEEALRDLVESVKTKGVIQPLIVRMGNAGKYEIIGGEPDEGEEPPEKKPRDWKDSRTS